MRAGVFSTWGQDDPPIYMAGSKPGAIPRSSSAQPLTHGTKRLDLSICGRHSPTRKPNNEHASESRYPRLGSATESGDHRLGIMVRLRRHFSRSGSQLGPHCSRQTPLRRDEQLVSALAKNGARNLVKGYLDSVRTLADVATHLDNVLADEKVDNPPAVLAYRLRDGIPSP